MLDCRKANPGGFVPDAQSITVLVLVKAAPVMTEDLDETMCVAGVRLDGDSLQWARLHPVPFRDMADASKFVKYQVITTQVIHHRTDRRQETGDLDAAARHDPAGREDQPSEPVGSPPPVHRRPWRTDHVRTGGA
jgi:hypothetical protein